MKKIVKIWGTSLVLVFDKEDQRIYNIEEGDIIDLSDIKIEKQKRKK